MLPLQVSAINHILRLFSGSVFEAYFYLDGELVSEYPPIVVFEATGSIVILRWGESMKGISRM